MEGTILGFDAGEGALRATDGKRYGFNRSAWRSVREPVAGLAVRFVAQGARATEIYPAPPEQLPLKRMLEGEETKIATLIYGCYATAFLYGITMVMGAVIAYSYRQTGGAARWLESHYNYQISLFWKTLFLFLAAVPLTFCYRIGIEVVLCTYLWVILKSIKGWRCLARGKAAP